LTKKDKIDLVNKSIDFVAENPSSINIKNFINSNLSGKAEQRLYSNYLAAYCENNEIEISDSFIPSQEATKLQKKKFKSIIKLDSNFHIYIHGNENLIENGVDKNGKKFYKIYYENEI
jgi:predicted alpha/beta-fold hydrolase